MSAPAENVKLQERRVREALDLAVEHGKLRPYEALEAAAHYEVALLPWVQQKHDYYVEQTEKARPKA